MGLKVLAPWAHPVSGIYYFRKVVPQGLRSILGRSEEKHSLHTRDPYEARRRHRLVEAEVADKWAHAHVQTITPVSAAGAVLTDMDAQALASEIYREVLCERQAGSSMPKVWERAVLELQQSLPVGKAVHSAKVIFGLTHQHLAGLEPHPGGLLFNGLDRHEPPGRPGHRRAERCGIGGIIWWCLT
jgi:hypothetical protein